MGGCWCAPAGRAQLASTPHQRLCWSRLCPPGVLSSRRWKGDSALQPAAWSHGGGLDSDAVCGEGPLQLPTARAAVRTVRAFTFLAGSTFLEQVREWPFNTALHYPWLLNCHFSTQSVTSKAPIHQPSVSCDSRALPGSQLRGGCCSITHRPCRRRRHGQDRGCQTRQPELQTAFQKAEEKSFLKKNKSHLAQCWHCL